MSYTQPAVSNHIKMVEKELGVQLLTAWELHPAHKTGEITYNYAIKLEYLSKGLQYDFDQNATSAFWITTRRR